MQFWRIINEKVYNVGEVNKLGFKKTSPYYIPQEYIDNKEFLIFRTCLGIGDWGIISAMPRLLKSKYPGCKVYLPSKKLLKKIIRNEYYETFEQNWDNPYNNVRRIFKKNPFIDDYIDEYKSEIYHDHFRKYDSNNPNEPLLKQILRYWRFEEDELNNKKLQPLLYFTEEEEKKGNNLIEEFIGDKEFGTLLIPNSYEYSKENNEKIISVLKKYKDLPFAYYTNKELKDTPFKEYINDKLILNHIDIRLQLYLKTEAKINIGYQSGVNDTVCRYSKVITLQKSDNIGSNYIHGQEYIK